MLAANIDLSPLHRLARLERVRLDYKEYSNAEMLAELRELRDLDCFAKSVPASTLEALEARGVRLKVR